MDSGFWNRIEEYGERVALITEDDSLAYCSLAQTADKIAEPIPQRSLVFLVCSNRIPSVAGYIGFLRKRIVPVLLNATLEKEQFENLKEIYQPAYVWCPDDFTCDEGNYHSGGYKLISTGYDSPKMNDALALLVTTSGSTGSPKLIRLSEKNIQSNTESIVEYLGIQQNDRAITTLPMSYVYGLSILQTHLMAGASVLLTEKSFFDRGFWDFLKQNGATTFGAVPYLYQMLDKLAFLKLDLPSLRYITQAGGKLGKDLQKKLGKGMREKGKQFIVMYGASEATARMSYLPAEMTVEKAGSIGIPIPGGRFELVDFDDSLITESNKVGELVYYGPNVMLGYAQSRKDLAKADVVCGRLETGDLAKRDEDGYYYIVGRKNRFLKIYGKRVNPADIEEIIENEGYEAVCTGEDDDMRIYTTSDAIEGITELVWEKTGIDRLAFTVYHIDAIPYNEAGKVMYTKLGNGGD